MLERHIMQAQARAMSADERELNRVANTCDTNNYHELGLPPGINKRTGNFQTDLSYLSKSLLTSINSIIFNNSL